MIMTLTLPACGHRETVTVTLPVTALPVLGAAAPYIRYGEKYQRTILEALVDASRFTKRGEIEYANIMLAKIERKIERMGGK